MKSTDALGGVVLSRRMFMGLALANSACGGGGAADATSVQPARQTGSDGGAPAGGGTGNGTPPALTEGNPGPFVPAPAVTLVNLGLIGVSGKTLPWSAAHAFKPGDLPYGAELSGVQVHVKSTWPDRSAKIAVLAGITAFTSDRMSLPLGQGASPGGTLITTASLGRAGLSASIDADRWGTVSWSTGDWDAPFVTWISGPVMSSWIYRKPVGTDAHLTAWLEVRCWATGDIEVLPWIENGYLMQANPDARPGTYVFTLQGTQRFSQALPVQHHTRAPLVSGTLLAHWAAADRATVPKHDRNYLAATGLVQAYWPEVVRADVPALPAADGVSPSYVPYQQSTNANPVSLLPTSMGAGGGHPSIGIASGWEAVALTVDSALAHEQMVREGYRFGHYHIHYRDDATNRPLRFSERPDVRLSVRGWNTTGVDYVEGGAPSVVPFPATANVTEWQRWSPSHQPAAPLLAYITTGRWWFVEECQFVATLNYLGQAEFREGAKAIVRPTSQMRQAAWTMRNLFIAACVTPDNDPLKPDFDGAVDANIEYFHGRYVANPGNPFGLTEVGRRDGGCGGTQAWQYDFWTAAWGRALAMRLGSSLPVRQKARDFFYWVSKSIVGRLGTTAASEWLVRDLSTTLEPESFSPSRIGFIWPGKNIVMDASGSGVTGTYPDYDGGTGPWWPSWGAMYDFMIVGQGGLQKADGPLRGGFIAEIDGQFWSSFQAVAAAASLGAPGALAAVARLRAASNWSDVKALALRKVATNAVDHVPLALEDFTNFVPAAGTRANINTNNASDVDWDILGGLAESQRWWNGYGSANSFRSMVTSFSGTVWAQQYGSAGAMVLNGGGHGGNIGAFSYLFDMGTRKWRQVGAQRNLPPSGQWAGWSNAKDYATYSLAADQREVRWYDYNFNGSYIKFADHTYLQNAYITAAEGGGPDGSLVLPQSTYSQEPSLADPRTGVGQAWAPHVMSLTDGKMTRAAAAPLGDWAGYSSTICVKDTTRSRLWYFNQGSTTAYYHDLTRGLPLSKQSVTIQKVGGGETDTFTAVYNAVWLYVPDADAIIQFIPQTGTGDAAADTPLIVRVLLMSTGVPVDPKRTDIPRFPMKHGGLYAGAAWCPTLRRFYLYEGLGDDFCTVLTPSSLNFATCTWEWSREQFAGPAPVTRGAVGGLVDQVTAVIGKWQWVPAYECFALHDGPNTTGVCVDGVTRNGIVQLWRPPGKRI